MTMRTIIDLPEDQIEALARLSERDGFSRAELIRRAVSEYLKIAGIPDQDHSAFGLWRHNPEDGLEYQNRLRREWA